MLPLVTSNDHLDSNWSRHAILDVSIVWRFLNFYLQWQQSSDLWVLLTQILLSWDPGTAFMKWDDKLPSPSGQGLSGCVKVLEFLSLVFIAMDITHKATFWKGFVVFVVSRRDQFWEHLNWIFVKSDENVCESFDPMSDISSSAHISTATKSRSFTDCPIL